MTSLSRTLLALAATGFILLASSTAIEATRDPSFDSPTPLYHSAQEENPSTITPLVSISPQSEETQAVAAPALITTPARTRTHDQTEAAIREAASKAIRGRATAARLAYSMRQATMRHYLGACRAAYSEAISSLQTAEALIKTSNSKDAIMTHLFAAVDSVGSCEDGFREVYDVGFPLKRVNNNLMRMVRSCLAMGSHLYQEMLRGARKRGFSCSG